MRRTYLDRGLGCLIHAHDIAEALAWLTGAPSDHPVAILGSLLLMAANRGINLGTRPADAGLSVAGAIVSTDIPTRGDETMTVETLTRREAEVEREALVAAMNEAFDTTDREELRDLALSGDLTFEQIASVERLDLLDYLTTR